MKTRWSLWCSLLLLAAPADSRVGPAAEGAAGDYFVYVGTYTGPGSKGILGYRFSPADGRLTPLGLVGEIANPSFLAVHPNCKFLYAVSEMSGSEGVSGGSVSAFGIDPRDGKLTLLNTVSSGGRGPCHLAVDRTGKTLVVANYNSGSVASFPIGIDGRLGEAASAHQHSGSSVDPARQRGPHAHCAVVSPDNRFVLVADLGLDEVRVYRLEPSRGTLVPNEPPAVKVKPGSGPRHVAFHPAGKYAWVVNEMGNTVTGFGYDAARGTLTEIETVSTLPPGFAGRSSTAEIEADRAGQFLYASNRGHDSVAVFSIDGKGRLTPVEHVPTQGKTPRHFTLDPTGAYLFAENQSTNSIVLFSVDRGTGKLAPAGQAVEVQSPVCVVFVPAL